MKTKGYLSEIFVSFQGEGAHVGRRHLFVRLAGCNLRCRYCDTPDSLERTRVCTVWDGVTPEQRDNPITTDDLGSIIRQLVDRDQPIDALALTGGEPLMQSDFIASTLSTQNVGVPVLLETNGVLPSRLVEVLPFIDIVSMDIKLPSNTGESQFWEEHQKFLDIGRSKEIYVKVVVDQATEPSEVSRAFELVACCAPDAPAFLQPMTPIGSDQPITAEKLAEFYRIARNHLESVRVLPQTHKAIGIM